MKPVIGITCAYLPGEVACRLPNFNLGNQNWNMIWEDYIRGVEDAGGIPVLLPIHRDPAVSIALLERLDGVLFSGGADVNPLLYGEFPSEKIGTVYHNQDLHELSMVRHILTETTLPVLAICRGMQVLNVATGGTLHQDHQEDGLPVHRIENAHMSAVTHTADITPGSLLSRIFNTAVIEVNSYHHQSVKDLGDGMVAAAKTGPVVEAIEMPAREAFTLGVQWHPEALYPNQAGQLALFRWFIDSAKH